MASFSKAFSFNVVRCPQPPSIWFSQNPIYAVSPPPGIHFFCAVSPPSQFSSVPWTLWLCLGFWAKLRIWLVPAWKMKPSSTCFLECGTPSWACFCLSMSAVIHRNDCRVNKDQYSGKMQVSALWIDYGEKHLPNLLIWLLI